MKIKYIFIPVTLLVAISVLAATYFAKVNTFPKSDSVNLTDGSTWVLYDEEGEGVKSGVLPGFKYPQSWYTYNWATGPMVEIVFTDGGSFKQEDPEAFEAFIKNGGWPDREITNECRFSVRYVGSVDNYKESYRLRETNSKEDEESKKECDQIISKLKNQVPVKK
ncbi:hypothetical protein B5M47_03000 [candidate division CPR3 bacterium 4484_211]|uniref:Uncharacterized protein n=1 Tax=candidate division CPR3 bacterium 4484_211 TaxID=1968527 RepID=A0A1W9NXI9_UNCC3|nr:MAG: hypothetical protein B5M47_03000 [candidate division CPR3 bacterium 4484_211]